MPEEQLNFKLEIFDGPLDLLLSLISKQKVNIYDIPIASILDQYLSYMELAQLYNADLSSAFIVMACELLYIKSRMLLPKEEEEEDPRTELVQSLIEYSKVKEAAKFLSEREKSFYKRYYPKPQEPILRIETKSYEPAVLWEAFRDLKTALKEERERKKREDVSNIFSGRVASVESKVVFVLRRLVKALPLGNSVSFNSMIHDQGEKSDRVATFLAILELISTGRISFHREEKDYIIRLNKTKERVE